MIFLGRKVCSFAKDGTCKFTQDACKTCKDADTNKEHKQGN